jgi:hypothetical protein
MAGAAAAIGRQQMLLRCSASLLRLLLLLFPRSGAPLRANLVEAHPMAISDEAPMLCILYMHLTSKASRQQQIDREYETYRELLHTLFII